MLPHPNSPALMNQGVLLLSAHSLFNRKQGLGRRLYRARLELVTCRVRGCAIIDGVSLPVERGDVVGLGNENWKRSMLWSLERRPGWCSAEGSHPLQSLAPHLATATGHAFSIR